MAVGGVSVPACYIICILTVTTRMSDGLISCKRLFVS